MDTTHPLSNPMVVRSLEEEKDPFQPRENDEEILGYLSDPRNGFADAATSSNHSEILAIHEASRECVWLRSVVQHIKEVCGLSSGKEAPTTLYEDNAACIAQLKEGYIKGDRTNHILPKFFFTHDLQNNGDINVLQIRSSENLANLFTKALPTATLKKLVYRIGLRRLKDLR
ncbi:uncharacterized protein LOC110708844 [Chenopodium quinoa]|uniref:uncharacterized protein LOC110708844 n=1 Tax=Chenopodium quinoa TaxID=63459 RepID=UPI000B7839DE|nr:uncharacterized protein LOC110708844 [Chenopodium quinoa]